MSEELLSRQASPETTPGASKSELHGRIGTVGLIVTVLAFSAPITVAAAFAPIAIIYGGSGTALAYVIATVVLLLSAVGYTAMTRYLPNAGAFYAYITAGIGRHMGLGASFIAILGYILMGVGTDCFFGAATRSLVIDVFHGPSIPWQVYALVLLLITGTLGYFRIELSAKVLTVAMTFEVAIVLIFNFAVTAKGGPDGWSIAPFSPSALFSSPSVGLAVLFAATSFLGFEATAIFREETKDPGRTVTRATYGAVISIGVFYTFSAWALITSYGAPKVQSVASGHSATMYNTSVQAFVGTWAREAVQILIVTSIFACLLSVQNIMSRYVFNLGVDRVFPTRLGRVNSKHGSPSIASITVSVILIAVLCSQMGQDPEVAYGMLAGAGGFGVLLLIFLTSISVVVFFRRMGQHLVTAWHSAIAPSLCAICMAVILYLAMTNFQTMTGGSASDALILQIVLWGTYAAGIVVAEVYRRTRPETFKRIGRQQP